MVHGVRRAPRRNSTGHSAMRRSFLWRNSPGAGSSMDSTRRIDASGSSARWLLWENAEASARVAKPR